MKQIKDKIFVDTNILIYAYSSDELTKRLIVQRLLENTGNAIIIHRVYKQKNIPYLLILPVAIVFANTDPITSLDRPSIHSSTLFELRRTLGMHGVEQEDS